MSVKAGVNMLVWQLKVVAYDVEFSVLVDGKIEVPPVKYDEVDGLLVEGHRRIEGAHDVALRFSAEHARIRTRKLMCVALKLACVPDMLCMHRVCPHVCYCRYRMTVVDLAAYHGALVCAHDSAIAACWKAVQVFIEAEYAQDDEQSKHPLPSPRHTHTSHSTLIHVQIWQS